MARVAIVTDTIASLGPEQIEEFSIKRVPVLMNLNGKEYRDLVDLSVPDFWKMFPDIKEYHTSAPVITDYIQVFEELSKTTDSIACIFVSKSLSSTCEVGVQARDMFVKDHPGIKIEVIDSRTAAGAQAFIILEMARAAAAGKTLAEVVSAANEMIPRVRFVTTLQSLNRLIKIGRAPRTAYIGELFQVKPMIGMLNNTGEVENIGRARGMEKAMQKTLEIMARYLDPGKPAHINVHYTASIEDGEKLKQLVASRFKTAELYFTPYSSVICLAIGPAISVSFYS